MTELLRSAWRTEPQFAVTIDPSSPLADRMTACVLPSAGDFDLAELQTPTVAGSIKRVPGFTGTVWSGASGAYVDLGSTLSPGSVGCTVLQIVNPGSQVNCFSWSSRSSGGTDGVELLIGPGGTAGNAAFRVSGDATGNLTGLNDGREHTVICVYDPGVIMSIYADRLANVQSFSTVIASVTPSQNVRIHSRATTYYAGKSGLFVYWNRVLSQSEIAQLLENPWAIFTPIGSLHAANVAAGAYTLTADQASFSLTGNATGLVAARILTAEQASFTLTGTDVAIDRSIAAQQASFTLTGNDTAFKADRKLTAEQASFALTGNATALNADRKITAEQASFALTGNDAVLTYSGTSNYTLTAAVGSFSLTGNASNLVIARQLALTHGAFVLTGNASALVAARSVTAAQASFALTGNATALSIARSLTAAYASYSMSGQTVALTYSGATTPTPDSRTYAIQFESRRYAIQHESRTYPIESSE